MSTVTESIGRVLAGRYRIESVLGTGASAHVFAAWDVTLQRRVAIKVLHPALSGDAAFLRRFTTEARAAAALAHPHVMAVFDWGEDDSGPFLVLELLGGGSLRGMLDAGRRLSVPQAVAVGSQAAQGLAYAHSRGFVHRDVKPANLLFDDHARLRIADFGLARALAEAALTEPTGATVGTARYAAPEQALGHVVDGRADVYSLALVLYESVTGTVPFTADTTLSTLMARVGAELPANEALGPLEALLERAATPEPDGRLLAAEFSVLLDELATRLEAPEPLILAPSPGRRASGAPAGVPAGLAAGLLGEGYEGPAHPHPGEHVSGVSAESEIDKTLHGFSAPADASDGDHSDLSHILDLASAVGVADDMDAAPGGGDGGAVAEPGATSSPGGASGAAGPKSAAHPTIYRRPWRSRLRVLRRPAVAGVVLVVLLGGAAFAVVQTKLFVPSHRLPNLSGLTTAQASAKLRRDHFAVRVVEHRYSVSVASGGIVSQRPNAGGNLKEGATVSVVVSTGPPPVKVPSLSGVTGGCPNVVAALSRVHLHADCEPQNSTQVQSGGVISWSPTGRAPEFSTVKVKVSDGPPIVSIPSLDNLQCPAATSTLEAIGLVAQCHNTYTTSGTPSGQVIPNGWSPSGSAPEGSTVTVQISQGPPPVQVPAVTPNETLSQMVTALQGAGLAPGQLEGPINGIVFATNPSYPASEPQGTPVNIYTR